MSHSATLPKAPGHFLLGNLPDFSRDPMNMYVEMKRNLGPMVEYKIPFYNLIMVTHPKAYQHVLRDNATNYKKTRLYSKLHPLVGLGLLTSDGELWRKQRRLAQPSFHRPKMEDFYGVMLDSTKRTLQRWEEPCRLKKQVDLRHEMMDLTLDVVARSLLGGEVEKETMIMKEAFSVCLGHIMYKMGAVIDPPEYIPTPRNIRFNRAMGQIRRVVREVIARRRQEKSEGKDLLVSLLHATDETSGQGMSEKQLQDEVVTMLLAGHETTAMALCWTLLLLSTNPTAEAKLREEVSRELDGKDPSFTDLPRLKYLGAVVNESMRLYPPAWWYGRTPIEDDEILGYKIPKGVILTLIPYLTHRDPEYWKEAEAFQPERFLGENNDKVVPYSYVPFAAGPRICIGKDFALLELQITLAMLVQKYRVTVLKPELVRLDPGITLRPLREMWATLQPA